MDVNRAGTSSNPSLVIPTLTLNALTLIHDSVVLMLQRQLNVGEAVCAVCWSKAVPGLLTGHAACVTRHSPRPLSRADAHHPLLAY